MAQICKEKSEPAYAHGGVQNPCYRSIVSNTDTFESLDADIGFVFSRMSYPDVVIKPIYRELMYLICHKDSIYGDEVACEDLDVRQQIICWFGEMISCNGTILTGILMNRRS